jgi:type II secretory pathway pseudopilin PulG
MSLRKFPLKKNTWLSSLTQFEASVLVIIIVLLFVLIISVLGPAQARSRDAKGESDLRLIALALEAKYHDQGQYVDLPDETASISGDDIRSLLETGFTLSSGSDKIYQWYDGGDNQKFCLVFQYESRSGYFTCSHYGCKISQTDNCLGF